MFQWQPVRTQRFLAPSALLSTFPPPWLGASELLGTEGLWLSISIIFSSGVAILATLGTSGWRGIFYQGSFPKPLPKEAQPARQLVRLCLLDGRWLRWARTPSEMGFIFSSNMMSSHPPHSTPPGIWWGDGLVANSPPLRKVIPVYRLPVAGEAFLATHLTWPVM